MESLGVPKTEDKNDKTALWHLATALPWALLLATRHVTLPRPHRPKAAELLSSRSSVRLS